MFVVFLFRTLNHSSVCPFIGMTHVDKRNAFVFGEQLTSARRYLKRGFVSKRDVVPKLLTELVEGLSYIHQEQLVHMELTEDTVMVGIESVKPFLNDQYNCLLRS